MSFDRVRRLDASLWGDSFRPSQPFLGHPQRVLEAGLDFRPLAGHPWLCYSRSAVEPVRQVSLRPLEILVIMYAYLGLRGKEGAAAVRHFARWACLFRRGPLRHCIGAEFIASHLWERWGPLDGAFIGGVTVLIGSVCWWAAAYKCPVISLPSLLPPSAFVLASASSPSLTCAPSSGSEVAFLPPEKCLWDSSPMMTDARRR